MADPVAIAAPAPGDPDYRDHTAEALARLPEQFRSATDAPNSIQKLLSAACGSVQSVAAALQQVLTQRSIDDAVGAQLDVIGLIVGQPRNGLDDGTYRRYLRATIATHRSNGTVENLIRVARLIVDDDAAKYIAQNQATATFVLRIESLAITTSLASTTFSFLLRTAAAGVRVVLEYGISAPAGWFRLDRGPGLDRGHLIGSLG